MFASEVRSGFARGLLAAACLMTMGVAQVVAEARPTGVTGPEAEAFVERLLEVVNDRAWQSTGAVRWTYRGNREHLWDRQRSLARVRWGKVEVLLDLKTREGIARRAGQKLGGAERRRYLTKAFAFWTNDSFWLNPVSKIVDEGTRRSLVDLGHGRQGLLVEYDSGGLTPGDAYLWILGEDGLPAEWRMWVSVIPIGGARATWDDWIVLPTGARISTRHQLALGKVVLSDVGGARDLAGLGFKGDPFADLIADASR